MIQTLLHLTPQIEFSSTNFLTDTSSWIKYDGQFISNGGERYVVIGNFNPDSTLDTLRVLSGNNPLYYMRSYYYIDGLWLSKCDSLPNDTLTSLKEYRNSSNLILYPNPSNGKIRTTENIKSVQIYNLNGKLIIEKDGISDNWIILPDKKGLYIVKVLTEDGESIVRKVVRE